jgi:hypothetical protein
MKQVRTKPNVFVVDTPHQLLNAIEAVHSLQLTNNHLLVVRAKNADQGRFMPLIETSDWVTVSFPSPFIDPYLWVQKLFGPVAYRWYCLYLHWQRMRILAKVAARFRYVDKLFLGHYFAKEKPFMRHLANIIKYNTLYLLDDGTDTIEINKRRHRIENKACEVPNEKGIGRSVCKTIETYLRAKYWNWHLAEAACVTFFTVYDLDVRTGDRLIRNNYSYLRRQAPVQHIYMPDTVIFLGQCIAEGYIEIDTHFEFLSQVREYFAKTKVIYAPHPRESPSCLTRVKEHLHWEILPCSSVIEHDLFSRGIKPKVVAGFVSSALITLAFLMDPDVQIVCFQIAPEHWIRWREDAVGAYNYIESKARQRVTIVPLSRQVDDYCISRLPAN